MEHNLDKSTGKKPQSSYLKLLARWNKACPIGFDGSTFLAKIQFHSKLIEPTKKQGQKNKVPIDTKNVVHGAKDGKIPQEAERPSSSAPSHTPSLSCSRTRNIRAVLLCVILTLWLPKVNWGFVQVSPSSNFLVTLGPVEYLLCWTSIRSSFHFFFSSKPYGTFALCTTQRWEYRSGKDRAYSQEHAIPTTGRRGNEGSTQPYLRGRPQLMKTK